MNDYANIGKASAAPEDNEDRLGGGGFTLDSGLYSMTIETAYMRKTAAGATMLEVAYTDGTHELKDSMCVLTKAGQPTSASGKRLISLNIADSIVFAATDKADLSGTLGSIEEKVIKVWGGKDVGETNTKVDMIMDLVGKKVILGVQKSTENKRAPDDAGVWHDTADTRDVNDVRAVFNSDTRMTKSETNAKADSPTFIKQWKEKWDGVTVNKVKNVAGGSVAGAPAAASTDSLF